MRISNLRTHLISLAIISVVVIVIYVLVAPDSVKSGTQGQLQGDRYIQIDSASWGLNCNPYVDDALRIWTVPKDPANTVKNPKPHHVLPDNALQPVSDACNGKMNCSFQATPATIGDDPLPVCPKILEVRWRCFAFDKLSTKLVNPNIDLVIDCAEQLKKAPANAH